MCLECLLRLDGKKAAHRDSSAGKRGVADETGTEEEWMHEYVRIGSMLEGLPARQAEVVRMRCVDGLRFAEIADMLGVSLPTVKSRFRYGIEKMRTIEKKGKL